MLQHPMHSQHVKKMYIPGSPYTATSGPYKQVRISIKDGNKQQRTTSCRLLVFFLWSILPFGRSKWFGRWDSEAPLTLVQPMHPEKKKEGQIGKRGFGPCPCHFYRESTHYQGQFLKSEARFWFRWGEVTIQVRMAFWSFGHPFQLLRGWKVPNEGLVNGNDECW